MESFCGALPIGMKVEDARSLAEKRGYLFISPSTTGWHPGLILDTKAGGGFGCEFRVKDERIVSAKYVHRRL